MYLFSEFCDTNVQLKLRGWNKSCWLDQWEEQISATHWTAWGMGIYWFVMLLLVVSFSLCHLVIWMRIRIHGSMHEVLLLLFCDEESCFSDCAPVPHLSYSLQAIIRVPLWIHFCFSPTFYFRSSRAKVLLTYDFVVRTWLTQQSQLTILKLVGCWKVNCSCFEAEYIAYRSLQT